MDISDISEGEEEDDKMSDIIEIWRSQNSDEASPQQQYPNNSSDMPRRNPPCNRKPPN